MPASGSNKDIEPYALFWVAPIKNRLLSGAFLSLPAPSLQSNWPLATGTGHYSPPCDHRATGKDGSLSTTSVNRRGPPSMPRAELGNHCLNRWPVKWKRGVHAAFKVAKRCASDGHCHPTFRHFHAAIQEALGAMSTKHLRQPASLTTRILQQFDVSD